MLEICRVGTSGASVHCEPEGGVGRNYVVTLLPILEFVATVGSGCEGDHVAVVVGAAARHRAAIAWVGRDCDGVLIGLG